MIGHHIRISIRRLIANAGFSGINIFGLSIGIISFLVLFLYVSNERSFDKHFKDYKNIYRITSKPVQVDVPWARSLGIIKSAAIDIAEVEEVTQFSYCKKGVIGIDNQVFKQEDIMSVDESFINMFSVESVLGNLDGITKPNVAYISEDVAEQFFKDENPIGKFIEIIQLQYSRDIGSYEIKGIVKNTNPGTHFKYNILLSQKGGLEERYKSLLNSKTHWVYNYVKLKKEVSPSLVAEKFLTHYEESNLKKVRGPEDYTFNLTPLENIHLKSDCRFELKESSGKINIKLFFAISLIILLVSLLNFVNLTIAKLIKRSKELSLKKSVGASIKQLIGQVIIEVILLCSFSIVISLIIIEALKPMINEFFEIEFNIYYSDSDLYVGVLSVLILCAGLSGLFVRLFFMYKASAVQLLKSRNNFSGSFVLKSLLIAQVAVVIILLSSTFIVNKQMKFVLSKPLGFNKENIVVINLKDFSKDPKIFANELEKNKTVQAVGFAQQHFGYPTQSLPLESFGIEGSSELCFVNYDYLNTMNIQLINNYINTNTDTIEGWVFNEHLYNRLIEKHKTKEALESFMSSESGQGNSALKILGIAKDFNYNSVHQEVGDYTFLLGESLQRARFIHIRLNKGNLNESLAELKEVWEVHYPGQNFDYFFIDEKIALQYKAEKMLSRVLSVFSIIGFLISLIGIGALSLFISQQRTKEIGIRKVNGAKVLEIVQMLNRNFIKWVVIAFVIATPIAYYIMNKWLENFAYKTSLSWWVFALAGSIALVIALLTVSWQTFRAARQNPVEALRNE